MPVGRLGIDATVLRKHVFHQKWYDLGESSRFFLGAIKVPTLLIQAADDPFVFRHSVPETSELATGTELELHAHGGHVGFIDGSLRQPGFYLERRIPQWLRSVA